MNEAGTFLECLHPRNLTLIELANVVELHDRCFWGYIICKHGECIAIDSGELGDMVDAAQWMLFGGYVDVLVTRASWYSWGDQCFLSLTALSDCLVHPPVSWPRILWASTTTSSLQDVTTPWLLQQVSHSSGVGKTVAYFIFASSEKEERVLRVMSPTPTLLWAKTNTLKGKSN